MKEERWIYKNGETWAQTITYKDADGVERCASTSGKIGNEKDLTVDEYLAHLGPDFVCLTWDEMKPYLDKAEQDRYKIGEMHEVDEERFVYMLEVLPPLQWRRAKTTESFKLSELTSGDITACLVRIGGRYFEGYGRVTTPADRLIDWAAMAYAKAHPEEYAQRCTAHNPPAGAGCREEKAAKALLASI